MKKLKLEELEVKSLLTSMDENAGDDVKGGTITLASVATVVMIGYVVYVGTGGY